MCVGAWSRHKSPPGIALENTLSTYVAAGAQGVNCCPQDNYEVFASLVKFAKEKHLPSKIVKYNKRKHMKSKWMTDGILKSINTKDKLYKILIQTDPEDEHLYPRLKSEFITHRTDLRRNIREAKRIYYTRTFDLYKNDI